MYQVDTEAGGLWISVHSEPCNVLCQLPLQTALALAVKIPTTALL